MYRVRKPAVAGYFYALKPDELKRDINSYLASSHIPVIVNKIFGIVTPHAGYLYSGKTAGYAYNLIKGAGIRTVVIIAPSHREYFPGISVYDGDAFETPLGMVPLNSIMCEKLTIESKFIYRGAEGHRDEHAVEVQLPFLQIVLKEFDIVPIVMGDQGEKFISELSLKLTEVVDDKTLIVASSDLSHYHTKSKAFELDSVVERRIINFEYEKLRDDVDNGKCEACGCGPIVTMMKSAAILHNNGSAVLNRSDSGDVSGDNKEVVGYLSAAIYGD
jgi:AmmeMemoRadiSam system protein B